MKKILLVVLVALMVANTVCCLKKDRDVSPEDVSQQESEVIMNTENSMFDVDPCLSDISFEEIMDVCLLASGISNENIEGNNDDHNNDYIYMPDYQLELSDVISQGYYYAEEYEYHINRSVIIDGIGVRVYEFDDFEWSKNAFLTIANSINSTESGEFINCIEEGVFFYSDNDVYNKFSASYLLNDCILDFEYHYNSGNPDDYQLYLEICEELGLPTCDEVTEDIMGSSN